MDMEKMAPRRPYLVRAFYEWLVDNELTPHLVVDATMPGVRVPMEFVQDGQIVLNIVPHAVGNLELGNEAITFNARFSGRPHAIIVPMYAVQAIYARENGAGTVFEPEDAYLEEHIEEQDEAILKEEPQPRLSSVVEAEKEVSEPVSDVEPDNEPPRPTGRPTLRLV